MPVMGQGSPDDQEVEEALDLVLELLKDKYGCLKHPVPKLPHSKEIRESRIKNLKNAIRDMIELEYWESF